MGKLSEAASLGFQCPSLSESCRCAVLLCSKLSGLVVNTPEPVDLQESCGFWGFFWLFVLITFVLARWVAPGVQTLSLEHEGKGSDH